MVEDRTQITETTAETAEEKRGQDYPLTEVPASARAGLFSLSMVLAGFTFFTSVMWAGGELGVHYKFWPDLMYVVIVGDFLLGTYAAVLGYIAFSTGLHAGLLSRFCFGNKGSRWSDFLYGFTQIGWYAWGTALITDLVLQLAGITKENTASYPYIYVILIIFFGFFFVITAYGGYKAMELLSIVAVPLVTCLILYSIYVSTVKVGGLEGLQKILPKEPMTTAAAMTLVFGTFVSGATQSTNWSRFASKGWHAVIASFVGFFIGNGLMIFAGAYGGYVYQDPDVARVMALQGMAIPAYVLLILNVWTTQDNEIYCFSVACCNAFRIKARKGITLTGAVIAIIMALGGIYNYLIDFIIISGTVIPPIGGTMLADWLIKHKRRYSKIAETEFKDYNLTGIGAYIIGAAAALFSPGIPPINGIIAAFIAYPILDKILQAMGMSQDHRVLALGEVKQQV
ncbi:cytosine permease [uncultured Fretibacterium sp.]|uniref:cytosine permease n=1 Tax=uncultured Fretibacterium sp. TaxID=1678694 RepID=UPI0026170397|nr:cytosine permease [uncultured Fretibacterium sp.]